MKLFLKKIYIGAVRFFQTIVSLLSVLLFSRLSTRKKMKRILQQQDRPASVLVNGPSLKEILTNKQFLLHETDCIAANYFCHTEFFDIIKPRYYIILDPGFFLESNNAIIDKLLCSLLKANWDMELFIPNYKYSKYYQKKLENSNVRVVLYNLTRVKGGRKFSNYLYHLGLGIPSSINVLIPAIMEMINLGYKTIYLYGAEFSWLKSMDVDPNNGKMFLNDKHFYSDKSIRYFDKGGYQKYLSGTLDAMNAMEDIYYYAKSKNVKIVNRTKGSFIDVFEYENPDLINAI